jgi:hypothetical protein
LAISDTLRRTHPSELNRALAAHQRRARVIAELHEQTIASVNPPSAPRKEIEAGMTQDARQGKKEAWFCAGVFLLALGCIVAAGCILITTVPWRWLGLIYRPSNTRPTSRAHASVLDTISSAESASVAQFHKQTSTALRVSILFQAKLFGGQQ